MYERFLIVLNCFAAAASFVVIWFIPTPGFLGPLVIVVGLVGVAYFVQRAEARRTALRGRAPDQ